MSFIKQFIKQQTISRRNFLLASAYGVGGATLGSMLPRHALAADEPTIGWVYRNRGNPYWGSIAQGGVAFVESLGRPGDSMVHLLHEGSNEKCLSDVKALMAKTGGNCALAADVNDAPNARPVTEAVKKAGGYISTMWNKTDDLHPWDVGDNYVAHLSWNGIGPAEQVADELIRKMGGKGNIVGLGGIASNNPAIERKQGLLNAIEKNPDVQLLDFQDADWNDQKANAALSAMITRHGLDNIQGVFAANDGMAFGAVEALRAEGMNGTIPVSGFDGTEEAANLIVSGDMCATVFSNPNWAGGVLAALSYHAAIGTFKPSDEPEEHREIFGPNALVTENDAKAFIDDYVKNIPEYDWNSFWEPKVAG